MTITAVNDTPVATAGTLAVTEDVATTGTLVATDADGDALTFSIGTAPTRGTVTILDRATGAYRYVPNPDANGTDSFTFTASDGTAVSAVATVAVTIAAVNDAPLATAGTLAATEDRVATGTLVATDPDGDTLEFSISRAPARGTIVITNAATGAYRYEPAADVNGSDSFEFVARDATLASMPVAVSVTIAAVNDVPVAAAGTLAVTEDVAATGTLAAADVDGDALSFSVATAPTKGTVTILDRATGAYRYVPRPDANGPDSFTFTATDGTAASAPATVAIAIAAVNDAPDAQALVLAVTEDQAASGTLRGSDADGDALEYVLVGAPTKGRVQLLDAATGRFSYVPNANATGADAFTYTVRDGTAAAPAATVSITIAAVNDVPVAEAGAFTVAEDATFEGTLRARDADGDALTYAIATAPAKGTLTLVDAAAGTFRYVPRANATGTDAFSFVASDGTATSAAATITVTIGSTNDPPVAVGGTLAAVEDTTATGRLTGTDSDADALVYEIATPPSVGTVTLVDAAAGTYRYQPNPDANGADSFTFVVRDAVSVSAPARVEIAVAAVNDAPTAAGRSLATDEDVAATFDLAGADVDGDVLEYSIVTPPSRGKVTAVAGVPGRFRYAPDADANGADAFTYRVSDGTAESATATVAIDVRAVNDPPRLANAAFFVDEDVASTITLTATDPDGEALQFSVQEAPTRGTITVRDAAQGVFLYTPPRDGVGADRYVARVADAAGATAVAEITVTIRPANDAPVATNLAAQLAEDSTLTLRLVAQDPDGDALVFALASAPRHGQVQLLDAATGEIRYVPAPNFNGTDSITFVARDGSQASAPATVTFEVRPVDDPPVFGSFGLATVEGTAVGQRLPATDSDGEPLVWRVVRGPVRGSVTLNGAELAYAPAGHANGPDEFVLRASDGRTESPDVVVSVVVAPVNDPPQALAGTLNTREGAAASGSLLGSDPDGDALRFLIVRAPDNGRVDIVDESTGAYRYVPNAGFSGRDTFDFAAFDGLAQSARATVTVTVEAVTPAPPVTPPPPAPAQNSGGGGGSFGWPAALALLCLALARMARRRRPIAGA